MGEYVVLGPRVANYVTLAKDVNSDFAQLPDDTRKMFAKFTRDGDTIEFEFVASAWKAGPFGGVSHSGKLTFLVSNDFVISCEKADCKEMAPKTLDELSKITLPGGTPYKASHLDTLLDLSASEKESDSKPATEFLKAYVDKLLASPGNLAKEASDNLFKISTSGNKVLADYCNNRIKTQLGLDNSDSANADIKKLREFDLVLGLVKSAGGDNAKLQAALKTEIEDNFSITLDKAKEHLKSLGLTDPNKLFADTTMTGNYAVPVETDIKSARKVLLSMALTSAVRVCGGADKIAISSNLIRSMLVDCATTKLGVPSPLLRVAFDAADTGDDDKKVFANKEIEDISVKAAAKAVPPPAVSGSGATKANQGETGSVLRFSSQKLSEAIKSKLPEGTEIKDLLDINKYRGAALDDFKFGSELKTEYSAYLFWRSAVQAQFKIDLRSLSLGILSSGTTKPTDVEVDDHATTILVDLLKMNPTVSFGPFQK